MLASSTRSTAATSDTAHRRDEDVARMLDLLVDSDVRMVTIVGPGGIGKSRLALAVAGGARERCPDGIVYVDLAPLTESSLVLPTIAKSLGIEEHPDASVANRLAAARMLIVLDNMEQLADAAGDLSDLLAATNALLLLVTSRRLLNIRGERVYTVEPLAVPADGTVTAAVELFLDRARSIHPGYKPSAADLSTFAELSRRLDGLPLAIELAAAWLRVLSPPALLQRMGHQRLALLREGVWDLPARQRTLRDVRSGGPAVDRRRWTTRSHVIDRPHGWRCGSSACCARGIRLDPVRLTEYGSPWGEQEQPVA